jgi:hypothetical protein
MAGLECQTRVGVAGDRVEDVVEADERLPWLVAIGVAHASCQSVFESGTRLAFQILSARLTSRSSVPV